MDVALVRDEVEGRERNHLPAANAHDHRYGGGIATVQLPRTWIQDLETSRRGGTVEGGSGVDDHRERSPDHEAPSGDCSEPESGCPETWAVC
jgi:hypothetical protein